MASIYKEFVIEADPDQVWEALRDFGAVHQRLVPGFVLDCRMDGHVRVVTFANGMVAREVLVGMDEPARRLSYAAVGGMADHHNASAQVFPHEGG